MSAYYNPDEILVTIDPAAAGLTTTGRDAWICPPDATYMLYSGQAVWGTASGAGGSIHLRKITDTSASNAAAGATVIELITGNEQALTGAANTPIDLDFINTESSVLFTDGDRLSWHLDATIAPLADLLVQLKLIKVGG